MSETHQMYGKEMMQEGYTYGARRVGWGIIFHNQHHKNSENNRAIYLPKAGNRARIAQQMSHVGV